MVIKSRYGIVRYDITTVISAWWTKLTFKYKIFADGLIQFDFKKNNYWGVLWRGIGKTLTTAMYKQAKAINNNFLYGRTIGGLDVELIAHWLGYVLSGAYRVQVVDLGSAIKGRGHYDSNAWFWESCNVAKNIYKINLFNIWGYVSMIRDMMRYM